MQALRQAGQNQEMLQFTQGVYEARELALSRMQAEATAGQVVRHRRGQRGCLQPRLGRARDRVPGHRHGHPPPGRRAPAAGHLAQAHLHPRPRRLTREAPLPARSHRRPRVHGLVGRPSARCSPGSSAAAPPARSAPRRVSAWTASTCQVAPVRPVRQRCSMMPSSRSASRRPRPTARARRTPAAAAGAAPARSPGTSPRPGQ